MQGTLFPQELNYLEAGRDSPFCKKCGLDRCGAKNPYLSYSGSETPKITFVFDAISKREDEAGCIGTDRSWAAFFRATVTELCEQLSIDSSQYRWASITRCAGYGKINLKTKGSHCKAFLVQDIIKHTPRIIVPIGTLPLSLLSFKSDIQLWDGKLLTYRGWPDDWLVDLKMQDKHPFLGPKPDLNVCMIPIQNPNLVWATKDKKQVNNWRQRLSAILQYSESPIRPEQDYLRPWYKVTTDANEVRQSLQSLIDKPGQIVTFDTETTGLKPFGKGSSIVFMMLRWDEGGTPKSIGFPWDYSTSPLKPHLSELAPIVLRALYLNRLRGHNLAFDVLFVAGTVLGADLNKLAEAMDCDSLHLLYTLHQQRGGLGLDVVAYNWVPDLAGYDEPMSLLIKKHGELLNPADGKGGHYANCPKELWGSHLVPYVMGDVEVCHHLCVKAEKSLSNAKTYTIPLAQPNSDKLRLYHPPSRKWLYDKIICRASRVLTKMMGRGMHVDLEELTRQELILPRQIKELRDILRQVDSKILNWCEQNEATDPKWELDLEKPAHLRTILFDLLKLPVQRLTDSAEGVDMADEDRIKFAATDKFTLNRLCAENPQIRPLLKYRSTYKEYSSFIRPLRNFKSGIAMVDKKREDEEQHLCPDGKIHGQFLLTGTVSGRLSSRSPNLQQLPKKGTVKRLYVSRFAERGCLYQVDLSQIELRLLAAVCGDPTLVKAFWNKEDLHALTASRIYNRDYAEYSKSNLAKLEKEGKTSEVKKLSEERSVGKTTNFLTGYGGGGFGLMTTLAQSEIYKGEEECSDIIKNFFESYPRLFEYLTEYKEFVARKGLSVSLFGRIRPFPEVTSRNEAEASKAQRSGFNHLIQATASDMMLIILILVEQLMREDNLESILVSTVHDSMLIDCTKSEIQKVHETVLALFKDLPAFFQIFLGPEFDAEWMRIVPLEASYEVGYNYLDLKPIGEVVDWDKVL